VTTAATTVLERWWKFSLVGAIGMAVQLTALAVIDRLAPGHYLYAAAAAVEIALLHNFLWHLRYTWRDRRAASALPVRLFRFHISNGLVSLLGNLVLMRLLVQEATFSVLAANGIAILCCSMVNFWLGNCWAFA
jgi:putative flippase GtrA